MLQYLVVKMFYLENEAQGNFKAFWKSGAQAGGARISDSEKKNSTGYEKWKMSDTAQLKRREKST